MRNAALRAAQRFKAQRRAQRSGASPLKRVVGRDVHDGPALPDATIRLRVPAAQPPWVCPAPKAPGRAAGEDGAGDEVRGCGPRRMEPTKPGARLDRLTPNGLELTGDGGAAAGVRCSDVLG